MGGDSSSGGRRCSIRAIARELDLDRKTVRRCLRQTEWKPYQRAARTDTLLATHAEYLGRRAAEVGYSAQVLFQELRGRQYDGSYETVKWFVRPLRETQLRAAVTGSCITPRIVTCLAVFGALRPLTVATVRSGTRRDFRSLRGPVGTPGVSLRFYVPCLSETLGELLDARDSRRSSTGRGHHDSQDTYWYLTATPPVLEPDRGA